MEVKNFVKAISYQIPSPILTDAVSVNITRIYIPSMNLVINSDGSRCLDQAICFNSPGIRETHKKILIPRQLFEKIIHHSEKKEELKKEMDVLLNTI